MIRLKQTLHQWLGIKSNHGPKFLGNEKAVAWVMKTVVIGTRKWLNRVDLFAFSVFFMFYLVSASQKPNFVSMFKSVL